jgi:hypothetical protein
MPIASQISQLAATDHGARHNPHRRSRELASFCGYDGERATFRAQQCGGIVNAQEDGFQLAH